MAKIESERGAAAYIIGFLLELLDEAAVIRSKRVVQTLREWADENASGDGHRFIIDIADKIDSGPSDELPKPRPN